MTHSQTVIPTGRYNACLRIECSCGVSTTADTEQMAEDRITAHSMAAAARDSTERGAEFMRGKRSGPESYRR